MKDYYQILGLQKGAAKDEVKKAFRKLSSQYHPDKKTGDEAKYKEITEAYAVLGDERKLNSIAMDTPSIMPAELVPEDLTGLILHSNKVEQVVKALSLISVISLKTLALAEVSRDKLEGEMFLLKLI